MSCEPPRRPGQRASRAEHDDDLDSFVPPDFEPVRPRVRWDGWTPKRHAALDYAVRRLSDAVMSRAINGVAVPIFYQGQQIGEKRQYNDRLAMFLLRYRDPLRSGRWVDRLQHRGHPEGDALELAAARRAVREDVDLPAEERPSARRSGGPRSRESRELPRPFADSWGKFPTCGE